MTRFEDFRGTYSKYISKKFVLMSVCVAVIFVGCGLELSLGQYKIGFFESWELLIDRMTGNIYDAGEIATKQYVVWEWRVPRMAATVITGAALGISGAAMQCCLRNVMADPYIMGISNGASLGVSLFVILGFGMSTFGMAGMLVTSFLFSLIPVAIVLFISCVRKTSPVEMILITVAISYVFGAFGMVLQYIATEEQLSELFYWGLGTLGAAEWSNIPIMLVVSAAGVLVLMAMSEVMNTLYLGDTTSSTLGVNSNRVRILALVTVALVTAVTVAFVGPIGFVGLIAPHACRLLIGSDNRYLYPASMLMGAATLLVSDCLARSIGVTGLPVGVITSLIGGPLFLYLLIHRGVGLE